jgi:dolichyl-phosphate beta-glucosyltransferase
MQNVKVSIVIPVYNEAKIIRSTVETVLTYLENSFSGYELIIADDGSTDDTKTIVEGVESPCLHCVKLSPHRGKGRAVREGIMEACGDVIVYTDADLAYGLKTVGLLVQKIENGEHDVAIGSRKLRSDGYGDYPPIRLLASRLFSFFSGRLAGFSYDTQCGIKAFSSKAAKDIFSRCRADGFAFDFEVMMYAKALSFSVTQLPVKIINHGQSKVRVLHDSVRMFSDIICIRRAVRKCIEGKIPL